MAAPIYPGRRLVDLARQHRNSIPTLARVIGRSDSYLRTRLRDGGGFRLDIRQTEREALARFFGVSVRELGG